MKRIKDNEERPPLVYTFSDPTHSWHEPDENPTEPFKPITDEDLQLLETGDPREAAFTSWLIEKKIHPTITAFLNKERHYQQYDIRDSLPNLILMPDGLSNLTLGQLGYRLQQIIRHYIFKYVEQSNPPLKKGYLDRAYDAISIELQDYFTEICDAIDKDKDLNR